jgi:hypothetical protein
MTGRLRGPVPSVQPAPAGRAGAGCDARAGRHGPTMSDGLRQPPRLNVRNGPRYERGGRMQPPER